MLPLLCKGYFSTPAGTSDTVPVMTAALTWSNALEKNRGDLIALDLIKTAVRTPGGLSAPVSVGIGGETVLDNVPLNDFLVSSWAGSYVPTVLRQPGGQTLQFTNTGAQTGGAIVHAFYQNPFAENSAILEALTASRLLKTKVLNLTATLSSNVVASSGRLQIPTGRGNVIGLQLITENPAAQDTSAVTTVSVTVDGVRIIDNVSGLLGDPACSRDYLVFPIWIRPGATVEFTGAATRAAAGQTYRVGVKLFFDDKIDGSGY